MKRIKKNVVSSKRRAKSGSVLGKTEIEEVNDVIGMNIPDTAEFDTFSGYVLEHIGRIPSENEQFTIDNFEVVVKSMDGNRIKEYVVKQLTKNTPEMESGAQTTTANAD